MKWGCAGCWFGPGTLLGGALTCLGVGVPAGVGALHLKPWLTIMSWDLNLAGICGVGW
jgi:hypothetical protein